MRAAEIDPHLAGLEPLLRPLGLVLDDSVGRWIPYEESMARRGLVRYDGEWITREEQKERIADDERRIQAQAQEAASRHMADAAAAMQQASLQMAAQQLAAQQQAMNNQLYYDSWYGYGYAPYYGSVVGVPGFGNGFAPGFGNGFGNGRHDGGRDHGPRPTPFDHGWERMQWRQPGSFLPPPGDPIAPPPQQPRNHVNSFTRAGGHQ
jgi:hypothetical protein